MKKALRITLVAVAVLVITAAFARAGSFTFGTTTYGQAGGILIVNSLGDQVTESQYGSLGYNDYIPENAFKNNLAEQGYTVCFDAKPTGVEVVAVTYAGRLGDPRTEDVDYVLKSEYEALNAAEQNKRITALENAPAPADGKDGVDGRDGKDGVDGRDGKDGVDGRDGKDGVDGKDGMSAAALMAQFREAKSIALQGIACSSALIITTPSKPGKNTVTIEAAGVGGESALGITFARRLTEHRATTINFGVSTSSDVRMIKGGVSFEF